MSATRTEAIKSFLMGNTHEDLANLYHHDMECQVNVAQDGGERVEHTYQGRQWHGWSDGIQTWKSFRIPYDAKGDAHYDDPLMSFGLAAHAEGIGCTGWDWKDRVSRWVAFDFDAVTGHSEKHGHKLTDAQLSEVKNSASAIPWVTVRKSTSGRGLHLYVFLEVETQNHNEHAALARAVLSEMSGITGFDFKAKVDICGGNMWIWHRKMVGTDGLTIIKEGVPLTRIPANWRDHVKVVRGERKRSRPSFIPDADADGFEELTGQRSMTDLDDEHKRLIKWLADTGAVHWWESDHRALVTHTSHLRDAHRELGLRGIFETVASGKDKGADHNCFCFAMRRGSWSVRRFSPGCRESESWTQDAAGWTTCYLNADPDLRTVARAAGGIEDTKGGFVFQSTETAIEVARRLGTVVDIPGHMLNRSCILRGHKDGRVIVEITKEGSDAMPGWLDVKGKTWQKILNTKVGTQPEPELGNYDDLVRHVITEGGHDAGWGICSDGTWAWEPVTHVMKALKASGIPSKEIDNVVGQCILRRWTFVNKPFQPEYPGDRQWNRDAARLRYSPSTSDTLSYPTWQRVLDHCGAGLDKAVAVNGWCLANGILTGGDYLKVWVASLFQEPTEPLPYLFFYGEQNCGKSTFHESLNRLLDGGYMKADGALTTKFNGELDHAILCVIEETNLKEHKQAYNKIKDYVTGRQISIHRKNLTPFLMLNTTHWVQCANDYTECPIFPGDSRITACRVPNLDVFALDDSTRMIPRRQLEELLDKEAPDFLAAVLSLELPPSNDRLNVPIIETDEKKQIQKTNMSRLQEFVSMRCFPVIGEKIKCADMYSQFWAWLESEYGEELSEWSRQRIGKEMPLEYPKGRITKENCGGHYYFGNVSFEPREPEHPKWILVRGDFLERE